MPTGKLYIVPTPIGNLKDITLRALEVLKTVDIILAEDKRQASILLNHFDIHSVLRAHHKFNEHKDTEEVCSLLLSGKNMALISDAGTPGISDPGFLLVRTCREQNIEVETLPGPSALIPAIVNSGLPCDRFCFEGFLPVKKGRHKRFSELAEEQRTMIFYESPYRLVKSLEEMSACFGAEREACVSRELTKIYEENIRGTLSELVAHYQEKQPKGEIVITVAGKPKKPLTDNDDK